MISTALHEAAHAIIAEHFGIHVRRIELHAEGGGICYYDRRCNSGPLVQCLVAVAGSVADCVWSGAPLRKYSPCDLELICERGIRGKDVHALADVCRPLLLARRRQIFRVARALTKRQALTGRELRELL